MPTTVWARHRKRYTCTAFSPFEQAQVSSDERSEQEIAEEYRRLRQEAEGRKYPFAGTPLNEQVARLHANHEMLVDLARKAGASPEEAEAAVSRYKAQVSSVSAIGLHDDVNATLIIERVLGEIRQASRELQIDMPGAIVSGLWPMYGLEAAQSRVP
jgi:hypothetical protein